MAKDTFQDLPFIKTNAQGFIESFWSVQATGSWSVDNKRGQEYAILLLNHLRNNGSQGTLFQSVIRDMPKHGLAHMGGFNGVSIGFLHEIAKRALG